MEYTRSLKFEEDPDYTYMIGLFEKCMIRHNFDSKLMDYTWKQNRLVKDKEALKNSVLNVIKKKPKIDEKKPEEEVKIYRNNFLLEKLKCRWLRIIESTKFRLKGISLRLWSNN